MVSFGDRVRVRSSSETAADGCAELEGDVYGFTTPSVTGVPVLGGAPEDFAINVYFEELSAARWFRPDLLEFVHHNAGAVMQVGGSKIIRQADGSWGKTTERVRLSWLDRLRSRLRR